jgi:DnaJ-class molecular chaperone
MAKVRTHYDNLKVTRDAPLSVIRAAYKALCQTYHPDKFPGSSEEAERVIKLVNTSYAVLIDPARREAHNVWIREQEAKCRGGQTHSHTTEKTEERRADRQQPEEQTQEEPTEATCDAMFQRAYDLNERGRHPEAFILFRKLADFGHVKAQFHLAVMYDQGQHVTQDYALAVEWYLKAAEQGNANAQYNLAHKYKTGQGVAQDDTKAAYWYRRAAEEASK